VLDTSDLTTAAIAAPEAWNDGTATSFVLAPWWWRTMLAAGTPAGVQPRFLVSNLAGASCILPLWAGPGALLEGLAGPYTCLFQPIFAKDTTPTGHRGAGTALCPALRPAGVTRLDALDESADWLAPFLAGLRQGGLRPLRFEHFGNWHEPIDGRNWETYLAARAGALRETIRRKARRNAGVDFTLITGGADLDAAIAGYEDVYARSWKVPEPFPRFSATMMREAAAAGALRLGLLTAAGTVIAAQIWIAANGRAMVVKLAHDEAFKKLSPGTVLTARMIQHMIDTEHVTELDFGRGDDPYKELWATRRRQRIGYLLANPWHPAGALAIARHLAGRLRRSIHR
jgi:hypothetical protein